MTEYLFLYGTLLSGKLSNEAAAIVRQLRPVAPARVAGRLYDLGEYPGAVVDRSARTSIKGVLFELPNDDSVLRTLDDYEEFDRVNKKNSLFVRIRAVAKLADGTRVSSWIYVYNRDPGSAHLIAGGDYAQSRAA
jgi:gamma-glutamylcyclotransferase (GGCT)/AIG2-like uncharacterized protein YtfP